MPSRPMDPRLVAGAVLVLVGFILQGIGFLFLGSFFFLNFFLTIGSILAGVGFLVAFLGLARRSP